WDRYVEEYAKMTPIHGPFTSGVLNLANSLRPLSSATAILDDGCGTGSLMNCLIDDHGAELPSSVRLLASDYSKGMVAYVEKLKNSPDKVSNPLWQRVETHVLDAQDLSPAIPTASLSHVISNLVFMGMDDATKPISAAYNVLEAGGILTFSLLVNPEWIHAWRYAQHLAPKDKVWNLDTPEVWNSNEAIEKAVRDAGFTSVEIKDMEIPLKLNKESL
ncbi:S-adenosyl-L-methionine-dependent methyltransferase, partial [Thozetella sp. PMI_491]